MLVGPQLVALASSPLSDGLATHKPNTPQLKSSLFLPSDLFHPCLSGHPWCSLLCPLSLCPSLCLLCPCPCLFPSGLFLCRLSGARQSPYRRQPIGICLRYRARARKTQSCALIPTGIGCVIGRHGLTDLVVAAAFIQSQFEMVGSSTDHWSPSESLMTS